MVDPLHANPEAHVRMCSEHACPHIQTASRYILVTPRCLPEAQREGGTGPGTMYCIEANDVQCTNPFCVSRSS